MAASRNTIRFVCSNCIAPLTARRRAAGTKMRCPWCNTVLVVPHESRPEVAPEVYDVAEGNGAVPPPVPTISFSCSLCKTRMDAPADQAGQIVHCPDCGTPAVVPAPSVAPPPGVVSASTGVSPSGVSSAPGVQSPPSAAATPTGEPSQSSLAAGPTDIYNVLDDGDGLPTPVPEVQRTYIPVVCTLCRTRMHVTEDHAGQTIVCPDCGTVNRVPLPRQDDPRNEPPAATAPIDGEGYALAGEAVPGTDLSEKPRTFTFKCPVCLTRLQATPAEIGQTTTCPDCHTRFAIPEPPPEVPRWNPFEDDTGVYAIAADAEPPVTGAAPPRDSHDAPVAAAEPPGDSHDALVPMAVLPGHSREPPVEAATLPEQPRERGPIGDARPSLRDHEALPPRRWERKMPSCPLVRGVFSFPFTASAVVCWVKMAVGAMLIGGATAFFASQLGLFNQGVFGGGAAVMAAGTLYTLGGICIMAVLFSFWISSLALKIVTETANGADRIEQWASEDFVDWAFESLYFVHSVVLGLLIGWGIEAIAPPGVPGAVAAASVFLFFPVILLSMLETGSAMNLISLPVLGSLFSRWWAWLGFYALAAIVLGVAASAVVGLWLWLGVWTLLPSSLLVAPALMIYFRLLGRLGWYISTDTPKRKRRKRR